MNEKKCGEYAGLINKVASGNASESETEELLLHAQNCPECFSALEEATRVAGITEAKQTLDPEVKDKIKRSAPKKSRFSRFYKVFGGVAAAAVIAVAILAFKGVREDLLSKEANNSECPGTDGYSYSTNVSGDVSDVLNEKDLLNDRTAVNDPSFSASEEAVSDSDLKAGGAKEQTKEPNEVPQAPEAVKLIETESEKLPFDVVKIAEKEEIDLLKYRYIAVGADFDESKTITHRTTGVDCFTETGICSQKGMKLYSNPYYKSSYGSDDGSVSVTVLVLENK